MTKAASPSRLLLAVLALVTALLATTAIAPKAHAATTSADAVVYVADLATESYTQTLDAVLYTEDQIGFMADRILWTEGEIGTMADRIVYVTELAMDGSITVIYMAMALEPLGTQDGGYLYDVALVPVAALPW